MGELSQLSDALLDLIGHISGSSLKLIVGGGFGIYLRHKELLKAGNAGTLLKEWPQPRSTNDLDLFLKTELLAVCWLFAGIIFHVQWLRYMEIAALKAALYPVGQNEKITET
jgi:hypothetical protein